ncbi:hypothetical protein LTR49_025823 [Elasticomyces elasticus]|nr:hypothetical protein LTR49_025823 [Elasticomyces elasticus]
MRHAAPNVSSLDFAEFREDNRPPYVAASYRWQGNGEATFQDVRDRRNTDGKGYQKVRAFAVYIQCNLAPLKWLWIDTCCINKKNAVEPSEAINLMMFAWYHGAELCLAYLRDVATGITCTIEKSEWFERGWTLQELLASRTVLFVTEDWNVVGHKGAALRGDCRPTVGSNLEERIAQITGIPEKVLNNYASSIDASVDTKMKWIQGRKTTRPEDMSYALFGMFGVTPGANYGEGAKGASQRLRAATYYRDNVAAHQAEHYRKIADWLSPPDRWSNHESARQRHEPQTGAWLFQHSQYLAWKSAIEDMRMHCYNTNNTGHAIFYFSFSDNRKQTYQNLILSLVVQLAKEEPGLTMLRQAYEKAERRQPGLDELQKILLASMASYDKVFHHLDALDECPEGDEVRQHVLDGIEELLKRAQKIRKYVSTQMSRDFKLSRLESSRTMIEDTLVEKADGMFRWVYCHLQVLKESKSSRPSSIKAALRALPNNLDETYERMLNKISKDDRPDALTLIRWLAYVQSLLSLDELAEASIVVPTDDAAADGVVDIKDRGGWEDTLHILAGLIIFETADHSNIHHDDLRPDARDDSGGDNAAQHYQRIGKDIRVRLAHFSVKEYLESSRILASDAKYFYLDPVKEHRFLAQSCLVYLVHYSSSPWKTLNDQDLATFPLLKYAAKTWSYHVLLQECRSSNRELSLLSSEMRKCDWLLVHNPDKPYTEPFEKGLEEVGPALYYASLLGLVLTARELLSAKADVNASGGHYGTALQAASFLLLENDADVDAQGGQFGTAIQAASFVGSTEIVQLLLENDADVDAHGGQFGNAIQAASFVGNTEIVQLLLKHQENFDTQGGYYGNTLQAALRGGHLEALKLLLEHRADVNSQGGKYGAPLQTASSEGRAEVLQPLLEHQVDVNAQGGSAAAAGRVGNVRGNHPPQDYQIPLMLLQQQSLEHFLGTRRMQYGVANPVMPSGDDSFAQSQALQAASYRGHTKVVKLMLTHQADVNAEGAYFGSALQAASDGGHTEVVQLLLKHNHTHTI